jgi:V/A-type H+-transporting ATPase subunit K
MTTAIILGYLGVAMMVGLAGLASAIGTSICGMTAVGAMKKNPGKFTSYMILSALPGSQGLYGFVAYFMIQGFLSPEITIVQGAAIFAGGIIMGVVGVISAYYQSRVCASGIAAIGNGHDVMSRTLILGAFPELYAILGLATVFIISLAIR